MLAEKLLKPSSANPSYIEDVFSTWIYPGSTTSQNIVNGIDLATKGGMAWIKCRDTAYDHILSNTSIGPAKYLSSNSSNAEVGNSQDLTAFNTNGFSVGTNARVNSSPYNYASWTFANADKFHKVVSVTKSSGSNATIDFANLGTLGAVRVKRSDGIGSWYFWHRSLSAGQLLIGDTTASAATLGQITVSGTTVTLVNGVIADGTYVVEAFAHNAGGFGLTGTDNVISCGSFTTDGSGNAAVNLGYEPQWVMIKPVADTGNAFINAWNIYDSMRGWPVSGSEAILQANASDAEVSLGAKAYLNSTGLNYVNGVTSNTFIYIAIRRGPMKVPTDATKVFGTDTFGSTSPKPPDLHASFPVDFAFYRDKSSVYDWYAADRLRGAQGLSFNNTNAESAITAATFDYQNGWYNSSVVLSTYQSWMFRRAPSFFDEICFDEATAPVSALPHNLTVVPELVIYKKRSGTSNWITFSNVDLNKYLRLNTDNALTAGVGWSATSTTVNLSSITGGSGTAVAYLFATCPGVSKVTNFTGNGTTQTINCGFAGGARFVLLKATSTTGGWYVYDAARGMTTLTDPYLFLNSTAAESATLGSVTSVTGGFAVNESVLAGVNTNGVSYIAFAVA